MGFPLAKGFDVARPGMRTVRLSDRVGVNQIVFTSTAPFGAFGSKSSSRSNMARWRSTFASTCSRVM